MAGSFLSSHRSRTDMTDILQATCFDFTNQCLDLADSVVTVKNRIEWETRNSPCELAATGNTVDYYRKTAANSVNNMV